MKQTHEIGQLAEYCCILRLWLTGWRILARRWKHPKGEIDLIAMRAGQLAFIEVKARKNRQSALEAVRYEQRRRITQAAEIWLQQSSKYAGLSIQFDIMWVTNWPWPGRLCHAWTGS